MANCWKCGVEIPRMHDEYCANCAGEGDYLYPIAAEDDKDEQGA